MFKLIKSEFVGLFVHYAVEQNKQPYRRWTLKNENQIFIVLAELHQSVYREVGGAQRRGNTALKKRESDGEQLATLQGRIQG